MSNFMIYLGQTLPLIVLVVLCIAFGYVIRGNRDLARCDMLKGFWIYMALEWPNTTLLVVCSAAFLLGAWWGGAWS